MNKPSEHYDYIYRSMVRRRNFTYRRCRFENVLSPLVAFIIFILIQPYFQSLFDDLRLKHSAKRQTKPPLDVYPDEALSQHGNYVTDKETAFVINVGGCKPVGKFIYYTGDKRTNEKIFIHDDLSRKLKRPNRRNNTKHITDKIHKLKSKSRTRKQHHYDAIFLVSSAVHNTERRQILRGIYSNKNVTNPYSIKVVFLVGRSINSTSQTNLQHESEKHRDILQGNFTDHYFNLTYKTVMGYRWVHQNCRDVSLILKIDDDVFVDVHKFFDYFLPIIRLRKRTIYGYVNTKSRVHRIGKFRVSKKEYEADTYPPFISGFYAVLTRDVIGELVERSRTVKYFRYEDVFTYGFVRQLMADVQLIHLDVITHSRDYVGYRYKDCVERYKYRCKYMAAEVPHGKITDYHGRSIDYRYKLGLIP